MMIIKHKDKYLDFVSAFNTKTGEYARTEIKGTGKEAFMASYPQLLDIGIMGHCDHAHLCEVGCYQGGIGNEKPNMMLRDYVEIMKQSLGMGLFQVALGGHGDPNKHEFFDKILDVTRKSQIVPNYTTSGYGLTNREVELTKEHCGAVAVSMYSKPYTWEALDKFTKAGVKTNVHWVLSKESITFATAFLRLVADGKIFSDPFAKFFRDVNAIVFLLYKPVGCGRVDNVLDPIKDAFKIARFFDVVYRAGEHIKIGFDSCTVPALLKNGKLSDMEKSYLDTCEGARFSAYITPDNYMTPCSFATESSYFVSLNKYTVEQAWNSPSFGLFRHYLADKGNSHGGACSNCGDWEECRGGCPLMRKIVPCQDAQKGVAV